MKELNKLQEYFKNNFYDKNGRVKGKSLSWLKKNHKDFLENLFKLKPLLNQDNLKLKHIEYFLFHNYSYEDLKCKICDKLKAIKHGKNREPFLWSCENHKKEVKDLINQKRAQIGKEYMSNNDNKERIFKKMKETMKERYGEEHPMKITKIKNKMINTQRKKYGDIVLKAKRKEIEEGWVKKYGFKNPTQNEEIKEKIKKTNIKKYGVPYPTQNEEIKCKTIITNIKKYGNKNPSQNEEIKNKIYNTQKEKYGDYILKIKRKEILKTWQKNYGAVHPMQNEKIKEKMIKTQKENFGNFAFIVKREKIKQKWINKYGVDNPMKNFEIRRKNSNTQKIIRSKIEQNNLLKYGVKFPTQRHLQNLDKLNKEYIEENFFNEKKEFLSDKFREFYGYAESRPHQILKELNIEYKHRGGTSQYEDQIVKFIKSIYSGEIITNTRDIINPLELDIYIPEKNLAIEFDGLYWHSEGLKTYKDNIKKYHLKKTKACESKNINLLHIFENEWLDETKQDIWKSIITNKLGLIKNKHYARKLQIKEVPRKQVRSFLNENHLQGACNAKINLGLYNKDELISLMTFSKPRYNKNYEYELIRFVSKKYHSCIGCAQRLFKFFIKNYNPNGIISYANRRFAYIHKNIYKTLGFNFLMETDPNYYYFKENNIMKLYHRSQFQKYKLKKYEDTKDLWNENKTEFKIMSEAGYRRIYDCGNLSFEYK